MNSTTFSAAIVEKDQGQISLRPFRLSDIDDFMVWSSDESVARFCRWDAFTSKEAALSRLRERIIPHPWYRAICLDGRPIGAISITPEGGCRASLGYVLASEHFVLKGKTRDVVMYSLLSKDFKAIEMKKKE